MKAYIVDSFTDQPFKGNPAGVCLPEADLDDNTMLLIAQELGLSETAFVRSNDDSYTIRYFSPRMEIPLCGHATLASARVLFDQSEADRITFVTGKGMELIANREHDLNAVPSIQNRASRRSARDADRPRPA